MLLLGGFFVVLSLGFSILGSLLRLLGFDRRPASLHKSEPAPEEPESRKVFSDEEGEYVDFEEVRE